MNNPRVLGLQTAVPDRCYSQDEVAGFYVNLLSEKGKRRERAIRTVLNYSGVSYRYSAVDASFYDQPKSTRERNDVYMVEAVKLGERLLRAGLERAEIAPEQVTTLIVASCTGFNVPGLDLLLAGKLGMRPDLSRTCVLGMGCYGAFPAVRRAWESVQTQPSGLALVLALELCSLHLQFDDSVETAVSTSLFADGAGMMLLGHGDSTVMGPRIIDAETYCDYQTLDHMTFTLTDEGFRMYLSSYVPDVLAANVVEFAARLLDRNGLARSDVRFWAIHPGSKKIVEYLQEQLELSDEQVRFSLETLHDYGNMSSATILFVLERMMQAGDPQPGDYGVMMAFGPGLTMESMLVQW